VDVVSTGFEIAETLTNSYFRNNDITDALELTFSTEDERFGETVSIELKPGGEEIEVTNDNKREYVEYVWSNISDAQC
jgi:E3 ubiquitin-protein ligase NEDD4